MTTIDLNAWVRDKVQSLKPYHVENFECGIKLHANENSFSPPPEILERFRKAFGKLELNRYPDAECAALRDRLALLNGIPREHIVIGNGSDELIQILLQIFCDMGDTVAFPDPTFAMYSIIARGMGLRVAPFDLDASWDLKAESLLKTIEPHQPRILFLSYPNNPTGNCFNRQEVQTLVESFPGIVVLDEAYFDFSRQTFLEELPRHNNLIVLRSLSKIGLAGLRVGYAMADPEVIGQINKIRLPYNSNSVSQVLAETLLADFAPVQRQIDRIIEERSRLEREMARIPGLEVFPSDANFLLFRSGRNATELFKLLVKKGILIRDLSNHPRLAHCLRVTVGRPEENDAFLSRLQEIPD